MSCIIEPVRERHEPHLPATGILAVNPSDWRFLERYARERKFRRGPLFHSNLYYSERLFLAGPAVGAPMAVLCLEKLIVLGGRQCIHYGWCGGLVPEATVGRVVVPDRGLIEEGTSCHYGGSFGDTSQPDQAWRHRVYRAINTVEHNVLQGPVWTTDAPYRETQVKVARYGEQGLVAVDMEYSALCTVAAFRKIRLAGVLVVSDELWRHPWQAGFRRRAFRRRSEEVLNTLLHALASWGGSHPREGKVA